VPSVCKECLLSNLKLLFSSTRSIISSTESVDIVLVVLFSNAVLHADYASIRGTLGYNALTSRQNNIVSFGRDCEMLLSFCRKSVVSLMYVFKFRTFSDSSCSISSFSPLRDCCH
jgi:hypothetical protein